MDTKEQEGKKKNSLYELMCPHKYYKEYTMQPRLKL